jgi:formate dehydrogenase maturation protein FdhE
MMEIEGTVKKIYAEITHYCEILPQYRESLGLLRKIIEFQSSIVDEISNCSDKEMNERQADSLQIHERLQSGQPLFGKEFVPVPVSLFRKSLEDLRVLLMDESSRAALDRLLASESMAPGNIELLLHELKTDTNSCVRRLAKATSTEAGILHFLLQTVLTPFFENQARLYRDVVAAAPWRKSQCPICGSEPAIARLAKEDGRRFLVCSLCHTEWAFDRLHCPFCEYEGHPKVRHFTADDDATHRVECCDHCRRYLKVVDERTAGHPTCSSVEDVITVHLDILAREHGYC